MILSMQHLRASQASVVGMTEPVFAMAIAWIVLGEAFAPVQVAGAAIVLGGVLVAERNRRRARAGERPAAAERPAFTAAVDPAT